MKRFIISIIVIIVGLFAVDRLGGRIMWYVNQHTNDRSAPKIHYLADEAEEDVIMMGASRCNFHYVPSIISDSLGLSVYNGGIDASNSIYSHYIMLNQLLRHHTPKIICLELMTSDYELEQDAFKVTSFFAPYIGRSERADSVFRDAGTYWNYQISHLYRYNAKAVSNLAGLVINKQSGSDRGYMPMPQPQVFPEKMTLNKPQKPDSLKLQYLQKFINLCKSNNITLVFTVSPMYADPVKGMYDPLKEIAAKNNVAFLDYHSKGLFLDHQEYFKDYSHLWDKGALLYSSIFVRDLKDILQKRN